MTEIRYTDRNAEEIDRWVDGGWCWGRPIDAATYAAAREGRWDILMTPQRPVPHEWFLPYIANDRLDGVRVLGLASGGGQQMPILSAIGASCTVLDYSMRQIESERMVAAREGYDIRIVRADMTLRLPFDDASFDVIVHPVSNCYVEDVEHVWRECARVLRPGGVLIAGMDNGINFLFDENAEREPLVVAHKLPYNPLRDAALRAAIEARGERDIQFSHTLDEQIGGQLRAGFLLCGLYEDRDDSGLIAQYAPQYIATRAIRG